MSGKRWFRRLLIAGLVLAVAIPLLAFGLSNLYLASPKGSAFVASKVRERTGLETSVMGSSWSPWNGISVYGIRIEQPGSLKMAVAKPLLQIESVHAMPAWRFLVLERKLLLKGIELRKPKLVLPVELLSQLPSHPHATTPPAVAKVNPAPQQTPPLAPATTVDPPVHPAPETIPNIPQEKPVANVESVEESKDPTVWVKFSGGGLKIVSTTSKDPLYQISKMDGAVPLGGRHTSSEVVLERIKFLGKPLADTMTITLKWHSPVLEIGAFDGEIFGIKCTSGASMALSGGLPFRINAILPKQENHEIGLSEKLNAKFASIAGQGVFQGQLAFPATWQGQWVTQAVGIDTNFSDHHAHFDQGQALIVFRNGALSCIDARLVGEPLAIIGNATLLSDGRAAANGRVIAPPETLVAISKFTEPNSAAPSLTPLSTPQRSALDFQLFGKLGEFYFKPNPRATPILLN